MKLNNKRIYLAVIAFVIGGYSDPVNPSAEAMLPGDWYVTDYYVNGQKDANNVFNRFTLERNKTFTLEDNNGILFAGQWKASNSVLTLTSEDETVFEYYIAFLSFQKMQLIQVISSPTAGEVEIRYFMNRSDATYY